MFLQPGHILLVEPRCSTKMRASILALITASTAFEVDLVSYDAAEYSLRSFNESCNVPTTEREKCVGECNTVYTSCMRKCDNADKTCQQLCGRDHVVCIDRCPCHDKCSWGCPCGFYQCSPKCEVNFKQIQLNSFF